MDRKRYYAVRKANWAGAFVNFVQAILKVMVGSVGGSPALFADGLHSFSDLVANLLVWFANKMGHAEPDDNHPYGHGRFETMAALILGVFLGLIAVGIAYHAVNNLIHGVIERPDELTLIIALLSIIANEVTFRYTLHVATQVASPLLRANAYHIRSDSLSSIIVFVGIGASLSGYAWCDAVAAVLVAGFILKIGGQLLLQAVHELTDTSVELSKIQAFEQLILRQPGVRHMHRLRTRRMAERIFLDVHILISPAASASEGHYIAETVRVALMKQFKEIEDITVHVDTEDHPETLPTTLPPSRADITALLPDHLLHVDIYYFLDHLEVRVQLPLFALEEASASEWQTRLKAALAPLPEITKIEVWFGEP
jgi:cation diffusion facilitator family transporter